MFNLTSSVSPFGIVAFMLPRKRKSAQRPDSVGDFMHSES